MKTPNCFPTNNPSKIPKGTLEAKDDNESPSKETPEIAKQAVKVGAKALWLQFGIQNVEAEKISNTAGIICIMNKCIKQEYQRLFLRIKPVFPVLLPD